MRLLICGGAGYIGAHIVKACANHHELMVLDNLSTGHRAAIKWGKFIQGDLNDPHCLNHIFKQYTIDAVIHVAAKSIVSESFQQPLAYYKNNINGTIQLLETMQQHGCQQLVFSSSAAVYGTPVTDSISEHHPTQPINPYGHNKLAIEQLLDYCYHAYGINSVSLRYFNAAGADPQGEIGESHIPETHLIPNILRHSLPTVHSPNREPFKLYGVDHPTPDGTCIRDYVHVNDLADAHIKALDYLQQQAGAHCFNLGNGAGFSVYEIIAASEQVTGQPLHYHIHAARQGDPARLVANSEKAQQHLAWQPQYRNIEQIIDTAWYWEQSRRY
ncbi:MAG TPA: UDP-glucose 4-epimerase GalE [Thiothrix sp.]|nr:UDP-glucose 4-epimerase GalE [Thiothrix sp.]